MLLAVDKARLEKLTRGIRRIRAPDECADRTPRDVVVGSEFVAAAVPTANRPAGRVLEHPPRSRVHTRLANAAPEHVVRVLRDETASRIAGLDDRVAD